MSEEARKPEFYARDGSGARHYRQTHRKEGTDGKSDIYH